MKTMSKNIAGSIAALALAGAIASTPAAAFESMVNLGDGRIGVSAYGHACVLLQDVVDKPRPNDTWLEDRLVCQVAVHDCFGNVVGFRRGRC